MFSRVFGPFNVLTESQVEFIHRYSIRILVEIGLIFRDPRAVEILLRAGARQDPINQRIYISEELVRSSLERAPGEFIFHGRNPEKSVVVGGGQTVTAPGYGSPFVLDLEGNRRTANYEDFENFSKLAGWADGIDCTGGTLVEPQDLPVENRHLDMVWSLIRNSDKPTMGSVVGEVAARDTMKMMSILFGGDDVLRRKPVVLGLINVNSPLVYDGRMLEAMLTYVEFRQPIIIAPFVIAGASGPITLSDALAQHNAEALAGVVLAQNANPGAPVIYGCASAILDMRFGSPAIGSPESALFVSGTLQMGRHYGLPVRAGGTLSDAKDLDVQSGYEKMLLGMASVMSGANFILHMAGIIDSYLTMSYESFLVDVEILRFIQRFMSGIRLEDMDTGMRLLSEVGPAGNFLDNEHTFSHYQTAFLSPMFAERNAYETWQQDRGAISIKEKAREEVKKVLAHYIPPPLDPVVERDLLAFIARRKQEIQPEYVLDRKGEADSVTVPADSAARPGPQEEAEVETPAEIPSSAETYPVDMKALAQSVIDGDTPIADRLTREGLKAGMTPEIILEKGLIAGMTVVGVLFKNNEIFVPEVLMSARAMKAGMAHLQPLLEAKGVEPLGKYVIGTVKGDLHDIGKNLVAMMLRGAGFEVMDLGVDTSLEKFLAAIEKIQPQIVGMSALLTTTMGQMARNIEAFDKMNLRPSLKVMVGGAPLSQEFATKISADAYGKDAADAVGKAQMLVRLVRKKGTPR